MRRVYLESNQQNITDLIAMHISEHVWATAKLTNYLYVELKSLHVGNWGLDYLDEDEYLVDTDTIRVLALLPNIEARVTYLKDLHNESI